MTKIKLIIADCDGTILHNDKTLDRNLLAVIDQLAKQDIKFTIATGRNYLLAKWIKDLLNLEEPYILDNGANLYLKDERIISHCMDITDLTYIIDLFKTHDLPFLVMSDKRIYYHNDSVYFKKFKEYLANTFPFEDISTTNTYYHEHIYKIAVDGFGCEEIELMCDDINKRNQEIYMRVSENKLYVMTSLLASKSLGIKELCNYYQITPDEIMVFGDNYNDVDMLEAFNASVAMGQAHQDIKDCAQAVCDTNENDGVSKYLIDYFQLDKTKFK